MIVIEETIRFCDIAREIGEKENLVLKLSIFSLSLFFLVFFLFMGITVAGEEFHRRRKSEHGGKRTIQRSYVRFDPFRSIVPYIDGHKILKKKKKVELKGVYLFLFLSLSFSLLREN